MTSKARKSWVISAALALSPLVALGACDQIKNAIEGVQQRAGSDKPGPAALSSVEVAARALAGIVRPESEREATIASEQVMFVPGEVLVGAKVEEAIVQMAPPSMSATLRSQFSSDARPAPVDATLERRATESAVAEAAKDARTVLDRLGVEATVDASPGGIIKIDLTPAKASPLQLSTDPATPADPSVSAVDQAPEAVADTNQRCPANVKPEQLEADIVLKTICTIQRLNASQQFEYVEKNYVVTAEFDRLPWPGNPAPKPSSQPGAPKPAPSTGAPKPAPNTPTPAPGPTTPAEAVSLPNDPLLAFQWDLRPRGTEAGQSAGGAGFEDFWIKAKQTGSRSVRVAVIDTGVDRAHPDIAGSPNVAAGIDLIADPDRGGDNDGVDANANDNGDGCNGKPSSFHGTHVAGTIGAAITNDRKGVAGAAWNVTVIPVRAIGKCGGELEDIINAIRWSAGIAPAQTSQGALIANQTPADIINMSLSVAIPCPASMQAAIDGAVARGAIVVVAAGNKAKPASQYAPANCDNVITVAASDARGHMSYYSNFGPEVDLMAPGGDVFADFDKDGRPDGILSTRTTAADCFDPETGQTATNCYYSYLQGTSMAAPHVAAGLALLKSQLKLSGKQLEDAFMLRAISAVGPEQCSIECTKNQANGPIAGSTGQCLRRCGRGLLDMSRAAAQP